jgi:hypothetical protein
MAGKSAAGRVSQGENDKEERVRIAMDRAVSVVSLVLAAVAIFMGDWTYSLACVACSVAFGERAERLERERDE